MRNAILTSAIFVVLAVVFAIPAIPQAEPLTSELIFPPEHLHNHGSCIVECPNGDLLVCWYNGSGERNADDVKVLGARKRHGSSQWSKPFLMADTPAFPDTNPCMVIDQRGRLWLLWQTIIANRWETALCKYKVSKNYQRAGRPPTWNEEKILHIKPGPEFAPTIEDAVKRFEPDLAAMAAEQRVLATAYLAEMRKNAVEKYYIRMGWMTRAHPFLLGPTRVIVPLYSDGFSISLMAITDDFGEHWQTSAPLVGAGNVQPSIARKKDGTLFTFMRDNGPPPKRLPWSESKDNGMTWSPVKDSNLPNPGSGAELIGLRSGRWALAYNDTERGRHSLAVSISDDEGLTWKWTRHLVSNDPGPDATHGAYPSIIQAKDGTLHVSHTFTLNGKNVKQDAQGRPMRECIKHVAFTEEWVTGKR